MTAPTASVLPIISGGWNGSFEYQLDSSQTVTNSVFYELHHINGVIQGDHHGIELRNVNGVTFVFVNTASNSSSPDQCYRVRAGVTSAISDNVSIEANDDLYILSSTANNPVKGVITVTSSMLWTTGSASEGGGGGGTSTEGSTAPSGSTYINSQGQIVFVINASSPSSDGNVVYKIYRRPVGSAFEQAYVVPHTNPFMTKWTIGLNYSLYDLWELRVESSTALVQSGILASYSTVKKVFSNFW